MLKHIIGYGVCALIVVLTLNSWHNKDKQVDALTKDLNVAYTTIKEKDEESQREDKATSERDEKFESLDKGLSDIQKALRKLQKDNAEIRNALATPVPPDSMRGLHSYANDKHEATGTSTPTAPPTNTARP